MMMNTLEDQKQEENLKTFTLCTCLALSKYTEHETEYWGYELHRIFSTSER